MTKESLRKEILLKLNSLSEDQLLSLSLGLTHQLIKLLSYLPELSSQVGAAYLPLKAEIAPVFQELLRAEPVILAFPVLVEEQMMFGLPEGLPKGTIWMEPPYHLVSPEWYLIPGVGFDLSGARLGRGKGYYDRHLEGSDSLRIGLAWSEQIVEKIPVERHDSHMDFIITEKFCWDVNLQKRI